MVANESKFYPIVKTALTNHLIAEGYLSDLEITGNHGLVPDKYLKDGLLRTYREKRLPTPDIMGWITPRQDLTKKLLLVAEFKIKPSFWDIYQAKGYHELFLADATYLISQKPFTESYPKALPFASQRSHLLQMHDGRFLKVLILHSTPEGVITLGQVASEVGYLPDFQIEDG
jgi:hypothetical protein